VLPPPVDAHAYREDIAYREDVISDVERALNEAAIESEQPHIDHDSTDRALHDDITYLVGQSWKAAEKSNHAKRKDHRSFLLCSLFNLQ